MTGPNPEPPNPGATSTPPTANPAADSPPPADPGAAGTPPPTASPGADPDELPLRVTTLELFFDLVFAFTLTQLASLLASGFTAGALARVLLIFGLLWWMYEGYAWLTNARPPVHTAERLLLLVGMAGFLTIGLAIPDGFGGASLALGLGYLAVVLVHAWLYFRVNRNIIRVAPFNVASALLVIIASLLHGPGGGERPAGYVLWVVALAVQLGSPLIVHPKNLFDLRPAHMAERHSALVLVALGESVAAIGVGAGRLAGHSAADNARIIVAAVLGLALAAALWWIVFGSGDEDEAANGCSPRPRASAGSRWPCQRSSTATSRCCSGWSRWPPGWRRRSSAPAESQRARRRRPSRSPLGRQRSWPARRPSGGCCGSGPFGCAPPRRCWPSPRRSSAPSSPSRCRSPCSPCYWREPWY